MTVNNLIKAILKKKYLFKVYISCSGDGAAIAEFNRYKEDIQEATGKYPVMIGIKRWPLLGVVRGIVYVLEDVK